MSKAMTSPLRTENYTKGNNGHIKHYIVEMSFTTIQTKDQTCCLPTSSQPFHLSERPWLPMNLLYNITGSG